MALGGSAVLFVSMLAPLGSVGTTATAAPSSQFPDVAPDTSSFQALWDRTDSLVASQQVTDRSWYWGPAPIWTSREKYVDDPQGTGTRLVQYWDKSRMEINDPNGDKRNPFYITNGLLTVELISGNMQTGNNTFVTRKPAD